MTSKEILRLEAGRYRILSDKLRADYGAIDEEALADTLEGLSDLPEMIETILRSSLEDECLIDALKMRVERMTARMTRFKERWVKKRELACWAMANAGIDRIEVTDFSASLCEGVQRVEVLDITKLADAYLVPMPPRIDRAKLMIALKGGDVVEGASLLRGEAYIAVKTR